MTFVMNPLMYPNVIKHGRQLDFHEFTKKAAPAAFGYPPVTESRFPGLDRQIHATYRLLHGDNLAPLTRSMRANLLALVRRDHPDAAWRTGGLYHFCVRLIFEATLATVYGRPADDLCGAKAEALRADFTLFDHVFPLLIGGVPAWVLGGVRSVRSRLIRYFLPQRMSDRADVSSFVRRRASLLEQHPPLTDVEKAAHHFAMLWASVANTTPASFWAVYHLLREPQALDAVRREICQVLELDPHQELLVDVDLDMAHLDRMTLLDSAIHESLRLSSAPINIRVAKEDLNLQLDAAHSVAVRRGDVLAMYPQSMHMDADIYEDPQTFRFDRYARQTHFFKDGQKLHHYLMPFGSGASMCPGRFFAVNEMKLFVCLLLLYFDLRLEAGVPEAARPRPDTSRAGLGILCPDRDVPFRYRLRPVATAR
ncbi:cytochrome P450 7A1 isoform X2 [Stigmatopora nigra]